jgi:DNA-binding transcriptional regulator/RsmH inhibitor MraZ
MNGSIVEPSSQNTRMEDIQEKIQHLQSQLDTVQRAKRYRQELDRKRTVQKAKLDRLAVAMDKEQQDVVELEKWSIKELFVKVIDKASQLEKEKDEYLQAAIAFQDAKKELELMDFEIQVLREKEKGSEAIKNELQQLYEKREADILNNQPDHPLKPVLQEMARWNQIDRELEEAIQHGNNAQLILESISQSLSRANSWAYNTMRETHYRLRMIAEEVDEARLSLPKLRMEFVKFDQEITEVFQFSELEAWQHDQYAGLKQVQQLVQELSKFTQDFVSGFTYHRDLPLQLHQTHTLANHLRHQTETSVKWLRLEQSKAQKEYFRLQQVKQELLG